MTGILHDRDGLPDPDPRPTGEMAVPLDEWDPRVPGEPGTSDEGMARSGAILAWGCLALLLAAGVVVWWLR